MFIVLKNKLNEYKIYIPYSSSCVPTMTSTLWAGFANTNKLLAEAKKSGEMALNKLKVLIDKKEPVLVLDIRISEQYSNILS